MDRVALPWREMKLRLGFGSQQGGPWILLEFKVHCGKQKTAISPWRPAQEFSCTQPPSWTGAGWEERKGLWMLAPVSLSNPEVTELLVNTVVIWAWHGILVFQAQTPDSCDTLLKAMEPLGCGSLMAGVKSGEVSVDWRLNLPLVLSWSWPPVCIFKRSLCYTLDALNFTIISAHGESKLLWIVIQITILPLHCFCKASVTEMQA